MCPARLQDTRAMYENELYFYTLAMNTQKMNFFNSIYNSIKINKTPKIKFNKRNAEFIFYN